MNGNKFSGAGNFTKNPEIRTSPKGEKYMFGVVAFHYKNKEKERKADFLNVRAFRNVAVALGNLTTKDELYIEGRLKQDHNKEKNTYSMYIVINSFRVFKPFEKVDSSVGDMEQTFKDLDDL